MQFVFKFNYWPRTQCLSCCTLFPMSWEIILCRETGLGGNFRQSVVLIRIWELFGDLRWSIFADREEYISRCVLTDISMQPQADGRSRLQRAFRKKPKFCRRRFGGLSFAVDRCYESVDYISVLSADWSGSPRLYQFSALLTRLCQLRLYQSFIRSTPLISMPIISFFDYIKNLWQQLLDIMEFLLYLEMKP